MTTTAVRGAIAEEHRVSALRAALEAAGAYERAPLYYAAWLGLSLSLYALCFAALLHPPFTGARAIALLGAAIAMMQLGLFAHDLGHGAVVRGRSARVALEIGTNALLLGYGYSYGRATHAQHHQHPNTEGVDPDLDSKLFALHAGAALPSRGLMARHQPLSMFFGFLVWAFAIRAFAVRYAVVTRDRFAAIDLVLIALHLGAWLGVGGAIAGVGTMLVNYAAITVIAGVYMGAIFVLPHVGTGTWAPDSELPYFERQLASARNYSTSALGAMLCGGLNLQIEHHLLPGIPSVRLRRARPVIRAYCAAHRLPYRERGYLAAWREVIAHTRAMSRLVRARAVTGRPSPPSAG
jgi:fatty acid desaturase